MLVSVCLYVCSGDLNLLSAVEIFLSILKPRIKLKCAKLFIYFLYNNSLDRGCQMKAQQM